MSQFELIDETGASRFRGTQRPPGGGSVPQWQQFELIANGVDPEIDPVGPLAWVDQARDGATVLLDLTDPTLPLTLAAGTYIVSTYVTQQDVSPGDGLAFTLELDTSGIDMFLTTPNLGFPTASLTGCIPCPAGAEFFAQVFSFAAASHDYLGGAYVVKTA